MTGASGIQFIKWLCLPNCVIQYCRSHDGSGHMGVGKTYDRILRHFFWPRMKRDVAAYIRTCQVTGKPNQSMKVAPLYPISSVDQPFEHLVLDCVGPLPRSRSGALYLLTVMCQSTRYPAAYPMRTLTAKSVVRTLTQFVYLRHTKGCSERPRLKFLILSVCTGLGTTAR